MTALAYATLRVSASHQVSTSLPLGDVVTQRVTVWRGRAPPGFACCGDVMTTGDGRCPRSVIAVETATGGDAALVAHPVHFELAWQQRGADPAAHISVYTPVCPPGFVSLGCVAEPSLVAAPLAARVLCLRASAVKKCGNVQALWRTGKSSATAAAAGAGSGAGRTTPAQRTAFWDVRNSFHTFVASALPEPPVSAAFDIDADGRGLHTGDFTVVVWLTRLLLEAAKSPHSRVDLSALPQLLIALLLISGDCASSERRVAVLYLLAEVCLLLTTCACAVLNAAAVVLCSHRDTCDVPAAVVQVLRTMRRIPDSPQLMRRLVALREQMSSLYTSQSSRAGANAAVFTQELQALVAANVALRRHLKVRSSVVAITRCCS